MDPEKARFLFGDDAGIAGFGEPDAWADLLRIDEGEPLAARRTALRQGVAQEILNDDPPEVWRAAQRIIAAGWEPEQAMHQLCMALVHCMPRPGGSFELKVYRELLDLLPVPRTTDVELAVLAEVLGRQPALLGDLAEAVLERLGRADDPLTELLVEDVVERLIGADVLTRLAEDRIVHAGELTRSMILTHRLWDMERNQGLLAVGVDLSGFVRWERVGLPGGGRLDMVELADGQLAWRGPEGWLAAFAEGSLLAVRVEDPGTMAIEELAEAPPVDHALVQRLRAVYDTQVAESWMPVSAANLVLGLLAEDRSTFDQPHPPLATLCEAAGLELRGSYLADDDDIWASGQRMSRLSRIMSRLEDRDDCSDAMFVCDVAEAPDPPARDLLRALDVLRDPRIAHIVATELMSLTDLSTEALDRTRVFSQRLLAAAKGSQREGAGRWLAAAAVVAVQRAGDILEIDANLAQSSPPPPSGSDGAGTSGSS